MTDGYIKMADIDFDTWNNSATVEANANGLICDNYTYSIPDINPSDVWAKVEHDYALKDFGIERSNVLSYDNAIASGMIIATEE